jgi:hypothetical protein
MAKKQPITDADIRRIEASKFDSHAAFLAMEKIRERLNGNYVIYQREIREFLGWYNKLFDHLTFLDTQQKYLSAWASSHEKTIERYEKEQADRLKLLGEYL